MSMPRSMRCYTITIGNIELTTDRRSHAVNVLLTLRELLPGAPIVGLDHRNRYIYPSQRQCDHHANTYRCPKETDQAR